MTSYEWQCGNRYGDFVEPPYNAITYTWGRWRLRDQEDPDVEAIKVHGIPWEIPRVKPTCFSTSQFLDVIQRTTQGAFTRWIQDPDQRSLTTDFLWLDVACIDQRGGEPRSASEIGRQARIFKNARYVFAWLSSVPHEELDLALKGLDKLAYSIEERVFPGKNFNLPDSVFGSQSSSQESSSPSLSPLEEASGADMPSLKDSLVGVYESFRLILSDPWFSSLWTLQEAFLRHDAVILSREGIAARMPETTFDATINELIFYAEPLVGELRNAGLPEPYDRTVRLLGGSGLTELATENPLVAYTASEDRTCTKPEDRIYGIQQIFDRSLRFNLANSFFYTIQS
ncbi:hypothetical protein VM1G_11510 [Cytospora mali]|uniref:Heterokaryon incompatibility domain-containing protein n=1 Tax=Cytospora mali TaxID=578113 RepID=A0A194VUJ8_CYTMA|nr:hypothetical protein VM1G_11510 [Valsa mali]